MTTTFTRQDVLSQMIIILQCELYDLDIIRSRFVYHWDHDMLTIDCRGKYFLHLWLNFTSLTVFFTSMSVFYISNYILNHLVVFCTTICSHMLHLWLYFPSLSVYISGCIFLHPWFYFLHPWLVCCKPPLITSS